MARPLLAALVAAVLAAGCSGGDRPSTEAATTTTTAPPSKDLPAEVRAFLDRAAPGQHAVFRASYEVLRKLGGVSSTAEVVAEEGNARITVGDLLVFTGDHPATCRISARSCVGEVREDQLAPFGIFSRIVNGM